MTQGTQYSLIPGFLPAPETMAQSRFSIDDKLSKLENLDHQCSPDVLAYLSDSLEDRHYRVVGKAAAICKERLLYDLETKLVTAYLRFLENPVKRDPNCIAKRALIRSLVALDYSHVDYYLAALCYQQFEPVWGGSVDTAVDIRVQAAMGLVASGYPRALPELTLLLNDEEPAARLGAVHAIRCGNPKDAELLLRAKALSTDEAEIIGECFIGLLKIEPDESPSFVARFLSHNDDSLREAAALALGETRLEHSLEYLKKAWDAEILDRGFRRVLIRAAALHRSNAAFDWLLDILREREIPLAQAAVEALEIYHHNQDLMTQMKTAVSQRSDRQSITFR